MVVTATKRPSSLISRAETLCGARNTPCRRTGGTLLAPVASRSGLSASSAELGSERSVKDLASKGGAIAVARLARDEPGIGVAARQCSGSEGKCLLQRRPRLLLAVDSQQISAHHNTCCGPGRAAWCSTFLTRTDPAPCHFECAAPDCGRPAWYSVSMNYPRAQAKGVGSDVTLAPSLTLPNLHTPGDQQGKQTALPVVTLDNFRPGLAAD